MRLCCRPILVDIAVCLLSPPFLPLLQPQEESLHWMVANWRGGFTGSTWTPRNCLLGDEVITHRRIVVMVLVIMLMVVRRFTGTTWTPRNCLLWDEVGDCHRHFRCCSRHEAAAHRHHQRPNRPNPSWLWFASAGLLPAASL